jgi:glycosyltransferase involved in cell wall biosynthesis
MKKFLAVCAIMKNEAPYLLEWLTYHRFIGVDVFFLYDNNSTDATRAVTESWANKDSVTVIDWPMQAGQNFAYRDMIANHSDAAEWCAFIDCDEFLCPQADLSIPSVLRYFSPICDGIYVHWLMFGSSGHVTRQPGLVTSRFTRRAVNSFPPNQFGKCVVKLHSAVAVNCCHVIGVKGRLIDDAETEVNQQRGGFHFNISHRLIALNHYFTKSLEEWRHRRSLGKADFLEDSAGFRRTEEEFHRHDQNDTEDLVAFHLMQLALAESS